MHRQALHAAIDDGVGRRGGVGGPGIGATDGDDRAHVDPSTGDGHGPLQWDYAVANGDVGYLNAGQAVTAVYAIAVTDPFGASAVETVTLTLNGIDGDLIPI
jgi:VCBS repeat-containing protein